MDPKNVQLTMTQKIVPLLKAINEEIPWQIVVVIIICLFSAYYVTAAVPIIFISNPSIDFFLRRLVLGAVVGIITFFICGAIYMTIEDKIIPMIKKIKNNYDKEALTAKVKVLEDAEIEMLKK